MGVLIFLVGNMRHGWQCGTYEVGNEGHEKLKLAMTDMWLVKRDMRLTMTDIAKIRVGNDRQPKLELAIRGMNIIKWFKAIFKVITAIGASRWDLE